MKMKKILCLFIAVVMVALACPLSIFAAPDAAKPTGVQSTATTDAKITTGVATIVYTKDGSEVTHGTYDTLDAAFEALSELYSAPLADANVKNSEELYAAAGNPVIKLNGNFDGTATMPNWAVDGYKPSKVITIVIDGAKSETENYTISCGAITLFDKLAFYNLTVKNTNIVFSNPNGDHNIRWDGNIDTSKAEGARIPGVSVTIFDNCVIDQNSTQAPGSDSGSLFKLNGFRKAASGVDSITDDKYNLTLKDCTVNFASAVGLQVHWGADANVSLVNTVWTADGAAGKANNNDCILKAYESGNVTFNIDGTSRVISAREEGALTTTLIRTLGTVGGDIVVNLEAGAELVMNNTATSSLTSQTFISVATSKHATTVTDKGAVFKANAASQKLGVILPTCFVDEYQTPHIWNANGEVASNPYKNADATAEVIFTHNKVDDSAYEVESETSIARIERTNGANLYFPTIQMAVDYLNTLYTRVTTPNLTDDALWKAAGSPVICVYKNDITVDSTIAPNWWNTNYDQNRVRTVYIKGVTEDGSQLNITSNVAGAFIRYNAYYNVTIENIYLTCSKGFVFFWSGYNGGQNSGKSTTNMINCYIKGTGTSYADGNEGLLFKVTGNQNQTKTENYIINIVNTEILAMPSNGKALDNKGNDADGVNAVFLFHHGCAGTLNIDGNSKITHNNKRETAGGDTMFMLGTPRYFDINIAAGAELIGRNQKVAAGNYYSIFNIEGSNTYATTDGKEKVTLNIEDGAIITISATVIKDYATSPSFVIYNRIADDAITPTYKYNFGPNVVFNFDEKAVAFGGGLITGNTNFKGATKGTVLGYKVTCGDKTELYPNSVFASGKYTEAITMSPVIFTEEDFGAVAGASVIMDNDKGAIRFATNVSKSFLDMLDGFETRFYTIAVVKSALDPDFFPAPETVFAAPYAAQMQSSKDKWIVSDDGNMNTYYTTLSNIDATAENFVTEIAFRSYVKITFADGTVKTVYTAFDDELHTRSMYEVATNLTAAGKGTDATKTIIDTVTAAIAK